MSYYMKSAITLSMMWMCAASGCSTSGPPDHHDPIGFTFQTDEGSFASFGWTGVEHGVVAPVGTPFGVKVTAPCNDGVCAFEGPSDVANSVNRRRCLRHMSQTCATDNDCQKNDGTPSPCVYIYDAPLATPLKGRDSKVGACGWSYIPIAAANQPSTIQGTLNLVSNDLELENLTVELALNAQDPTNQKMKAGTFYGACAECVGDDKANDGLKHGVCKMATHINSGDIADMSADLERPCDVNRYGTDSVYNAGYSMDCSPTLDLGGQPLSLGGKFASSSSGVQISITDQSPKCTAGGSCFCGMCSDNMTACMSDKECPVGVCSVPTTSDCDANPVPPNSGYDPTLPINQCKKLPTSPRRFLVAGDECSTPCVWDSVKAQGRCTSTLPDPNNPGKKLDVGCYPSGLGATIMSPGRSDRIENIGTIYLANTTSASCIPAGNNAPLNSQLGLPGLLFQRRNFQIIPQYAEDQK